MNMDIGKVIEDAVLKPSEILGPKDRVDGLPYETHRGEVMLGSIEVEVVQLNDGRRIVTEDSFDRFLAWLHEE